MPKIKAKDKIKREIYKLLDEESKQLRVGTIKKPYKAVWFRARVAERLGYTIEDGPSLRWYEVFLQEIRPPQNAHDSLDEPWTLAASLEYNIPPSATNALFNAWRFNLALDDTLTIRQARWIAYLSTVITETASLLDWAERYAAWEKAEKILFNKFESSSLDAAFLMSYSENITCGLLGKVMPIRSSRTGVEFKPEEINDINDHDAYLVAVIAEYRAINGFDSLLPFNYQPELTDVKELNFKANQLWIYAHWLTALSKGSEWRKMQKQQIIEMINELRQWIAELPSIVLEIKNSAENMISNNEPIKYSDLALRPELIPEALIYKAGFTYATNNPLDVPGHWDSLIKKTEYMIKNKDKLKSKSKKAKADSSKEGL